MKREVLEDEWIRNILPSHSHISDNSRIFKGWNGEMKEEEEMEERGEEERIM